MKNRSTWRSVRIEETALEQRLRSRHSLRLHGVCIGLFTLGLTWAVSHAQMVAGVGSMALRYWISLGVGYAGYLLVLRLWAAWLVRRAGGDAQGGTGDANAIDALDAAVDLADVATDVWPVRRSVPAVRGEPPSTGAGGLGWSGGDLLDAAGSADEAAVVVVPVVAVFLIAGAVFAGGGALLLLYFGWEALLAVAVELAFSYATARAAVRVAREGWVQAAVRLTWKPLAGAMACAIVLGLCLDVFVPEAQSLPEAVKMLRGR